MSGRISAGMRRSYGLSRRRGSPRRRNLCRQKRYSEPSPTHFVHRLPDGEVVVSLESEIRKRPSFSLCAREDSVVRGGANSTRFALTRPAKPSTCSTVSRASSASLIFRPSPRPLEAPLAAQWKLSKAEADATGEHQRNRAGEAVLPGLNLGAGICFETQFRIPYVLRE